jgi:hypothetical protein
MSKKEVQTLVNKANAEIQKSATPQRAEKFDISIHKLKISKSDIMDQILQAVANIRNKVITDETGRAKVQPLEDGQAGSTIQKKKKLSESEYNAKVQQLSKYVDTFISNVKKYTRDIDNFTHIITDTNGSIISKNSAISDFFIIIIPKKDGASAFERAGTIKVNAEKKIQEDSTLLELVNSLFDTSLKYLFERGHTDRRSVSDMVAFEAVLKFSKTKSANAELKSSMQFVQEYSPPIYDVVMDARTLKTNDKQFLLSLKRSKKTNKAIKDRLQHYLKIGGQVVPIEFQSNRYNNALSEEESKELSHRRKLLEAFAKSKKDWPIQEASSSRLELLLDQLDGIVTKTGGRVRKKRSINRAPSDALVKGSGSKPIKNSIKPKESSSSIELNGKMSVKSKTKITSRQQNWASLASIINTRLPEQVARNMRAPSLVNRTGRLASSAKVVKVEVTKDGYPSIVYDYQRDPYDVFDKTLGKSPWNTPARDPRALVDRSVREIVQEMAIGRFYTRRA